MNAELPIRAPAPDDECIGVERALLTQPEGEAALSRAVAGHVEHCPQCARLARRLELAASLLATSGFAGDDGLAPAGLSAAVMRAVAAERPVAVPARWSLAASAAWLAALGTAWWLTVEPVLGPAWNWLQPGFEPRLLSPPSLEPASYAPTGLLALLGNALAQLRSALDGAWSADPAWISALLVLVGCATASGLLVRSARAGRS